MKHYTCPMHPEISSMDPGKCPECHMVLEKKDKSKHDQQEHNHDKHEGHNPNMFKTKFWVSLILTIPVLLYSETVMDWLNFQTPTFTGSNWIPAVFGTIIFFYGGMVFLKSAKAELASRMPGMMTLISMAITVAFTYSLAVSLNLVEGMDFWWELATLVTIMLLGHWLEMASVSNAQGALKELAKLLPDTAEKINAKGVITVSVSELKVGDRVLVRPGSSIPIDGTVLKGESDVNESMLTGESKPVKKSKNDSVIAGTINGSGSLTLKVSKIGDDTALAGIMKLVSDAQKSKSKTQVLADKAAFYLTFIAITAAIATAIGWAVFSDESTSFILQRVVTVLIIACPHALGLAIPLVTAISTTKAAQNGLLIRQRSALESARNIDVVLFDKTGTLTKGEQGVVGIVATDEDEERLLALAASVESESEHPIAKAVVNSAKERGLKFYEIDNFTSLSGRGTRAKINGKIIHVGGPKMLKELKVKLTNSILKITEDAGSEGKTVVYVIHERKILGLIILADVIRNESKEAIYNLKKDGKRVAMLTGDSRAVAAWVANELDITEYFAEVLPENKAKVVRKLQSDGSRVAMVGDGVNDAPALTQADVGIAIGAGTDVAIESAGIVLAGSDPRGVSKIVKLSKATYKKMIQNLVWATGYNAIAIPLAAGVTAGLGFVLSPAIGAIMMSLSTIIVAVNAQLLRRLTL